MNEQNYFGPFEEYSNFMDDIKRTWKRSNYINFSLITIYYEFIFYVIILYILNI